MTPALTEILYALDLADRVVGVTDYCTYPPDAASKPRIGGYVNPSVEAIVSLKPDLVVVSPAGGNKDAALGVMRADLRVQVIPSETVEETFTAIAEVGRLCGRQDQADLLVGAMKQRIDHVRRAVASRLPVKTLFCLQVDPLVAAGRGTLPSQIVGLAGGRNVIREERYPRIGIETVFRAAPDVILQARMDAPEAKSPDPLAYWRRWPALAAVSANRVHLLEPDVGLRPGPRVADFVESLATLLHPDAFDADPGR